MSGGLGGSTRRGPRPSLRLPRFRLRTLAVAIVVIAIWLTVTRSQPISGVAIALVALPSLIWTALAARRAHERGRPMSRAAIVGYFAMACGHWVPLICVVYLIAGCVVSWFIGRGN